MKDIQRFTIILAIILMGLVLASCRGQATPSPEEDTLSTEDLSEEAKACVECHATETTGIAADWDGSVHAEEAVSCIDCHEGEESDIDTVRHNGYWVSAIVSPLDCAECHPEPLYSDLQMHDVASRGQYDRRDDFDTPALIEVWRTAPYMHDGHYTTMKELFTKGKHGKKGGNVEKLSEQELDDLVEFVMSL